MCGVQRIANQHGVMSPPAIVVYNRKLPPHRDVRDQRMPIQNLGKYALAQRARLRVVHLRESGTRERSLIDLDNERTEAGLVAVMMRVKKSKLGLNESLGQGLETLAGAEPRKAVGMKTRGGAEFRLVAAAYQRIDPIGSDDQVDAGEFVKASDNAPIDRRDAGRTRPRLQQLEEPQAANGCEADTVNDDTLAPVDDGDVVPRLHMWCDRSVGFLIVLAQNFQCPIGEHDAEPKSGVI